MAEPVAQNPIQDPFFKKPERPGSVWQLLAWLFFEYRLLKRYGRRLSPWQRVTRVCRVYLVFALFVSVLYLFDIGLTVGFELPARFPWAYEPLIPEGFVSQSDGIKQASLLIEEWAVGVALGLVTGLVWGLVVSLLVVSLGAGLAWSLAMGLLMLGGGFSGPVSSVVAMGLLVGLAGGVAGGFNFLPELLGVRFVVVYQDLQDARVRSVVSWMADLRGRVAERLGQPRDGWQAPDHWLGAWTEVETFLEGVSVPRDHKLILALDEYQELHDHLSRDPAQGARLLAAMRSFLQRQNQVVFMFVGTELFSELHDPDWANYFVQAVRFPVDNLSREEAERLITGPVRLRYAPEVIDRLFELTQGHPALLQLLCRKLVDIANREGRGDLSLPDLDRALDEAIERDTSVFAVFWNQFCRQRNCRETVERILSGEPPADRKALLQLQEHGYVVDQSGKWRMRVPLFESWLRRYKDAFA